MTLSEFLTITKETPAEFASRLKDASESGVRKWLSGERTPRLEQMREIFTVTNGKVTPNDFCGIGAVLLPVEGQPQ